MLDKSVPLQPGREHFIDLSATLVTTNGIKGISPEDRGCLFTDESNLEFYKSYTFTNCRLECGIKEAEEEHNCIPWHLPKVGVSSEWNSLMSTGHKLIHLWPLDCKRLHGGNANAIFSLSALSIWYWHNLYNFGSVIIHSIVVKNFTNNDPQIVITSPTCQRSPLLNSGEFLCHFTASSDILICWDVFTIFSLKEVKDFF